MYWYIIKGLIVRITAFLAIPQIVLGVFFLITRLVFLTEPNFTLAIKGFWFILALILLIASTDRAQGSFFKHDGWLRTYMNDRMELERERIAADKQGKL